MNTETSITISTREKMKSTLEVVTQRLNGMKEIATSPMKTSGKFSWDNDSGNLKAVDIFKCTSVFLLTRILGFLKRQEEDYTTGAKEMGLSAFAPLQWCGFTYDLWKSDIILRARILTQKEEEEKLKEAVNKLSKYMSEEDNLQRDLEDISSALGLNK
jgi:hypothetical protein